MKIKHLEIFEEMFKKKFKNIKEANCFGKFIKSILFIIALFFMLDYGVLLFYDSF